MDVTPLITRDKKVIQSYRGGFKVSGIVYNTPIIVMPDRVLEWPDATDFSVLKPFIGEIDVLLLGTGARQVMSNLATRQAIKQNYGITLEAMDTGAAARTYNVLMAEGRKIAAALQTF